jgi:glucosylceramidase
MKSLNRRRALSMGVLSVAAAAAPKWVFAASASNNETHLWRTSNTEKHAELATVPQWRSLSATERPDVIIDEKRVYQTMLGFGAALTDSSCYLLNQMTETERSSLLHELYSPSNMNLSVGRCCIGSSDYALRAYSFDDTPGDVSLDHFSVAHDQDYILPILRQIRAVRPDLFLHASPWSPPGWMKVYGSMLGGWMSEKYLAPYAQYLFKFLEAYRSAGVPIDAICTQNEVETDQHGMMPACIWPSEMESDFVRDHLGPLLRSTPEVSKTKIWLLDYNYVLWKRVDWQLQDPRLASFVDGVAWHGYEGTPDQMSELQRRHPDVPFYFTEWGDHLSDPYMTNWAEWGHNIAEILANWCCNITLWNVLLNEKAEPNIGPYRGAAMVIVNSKTGELERTGEYWGLYHYSSHIQRNARRIHSEAGDTNFTQIAFRNPDGEMVLVLANQKYPRSVQVQHGSQIIEVGLPENSLTTMTWKVE